MRKVIVVIGSLVALWLAAGAPGPLSLGGLLPL